MDPVPAPPAKKPFWSRPSAEERAGFWKGFILAAIIIGLLAYRMGMSAGVAEECMRIAQDSGGLFHCG
ncbi:MAG TPA: hypothetical protein VM286_05860 [Candidatus Thermoplasmatota archaeon]|nr:hypothetical protein [Candidatus Thermoplasmatota archaeon]